MSLRNKIANVLEAQSNKRLDDPDDALDVLNALQAAFIGDKGMDFALACESLRWYVNADSEVRDMKGRVKILLEALGEL